MRAGEIEAALEDFERAIELLPDFAEAIASHAECLDMLGRSGPAKPEYEKARQLWAEDRGGTPDRSYVFRQQGRLTFEVESYELALKRIKTGSFPLSASGNALLARGKPEEALRFYEQGLKVKEKDPAILALKGEALSMLGRYRQAVDAFNASLNGNPRAPETLSGRAIAFAAMGRLDKANDDWRRQFSLLPETQSAARACVALRLADYEAALPELERAIEKSPDDPYWRLYRLTALKRLRRPLGAALPPRGVAAWPRPLFDLLAGLSAAGDVLAAATTEGRRAEVLFQMERFREVAERAPPAMIEYAAARNELSQRR
ncbi:MAG: tetratricopeptide repeat protein [Enhydrobacter sp.]|nr:tetratricopeptide repeat protein [Enhydrobacter sp.]